MIDKNKLNKIKNILLHGWYDDDFMRSLWHQNLFITGLFIVLGIIVSVFYN